MTLSPTSNPAEAPCISWVTDMADWMEQYRIFWEPSFDRLVTWEPHGATTREELHAFIKEKGGMTQGWTGSFDKLDAYLLKN
jgi:hypothetical protein